jgi:ABC-type transporter Mla maintaining outer membrane lipid asymmetry ATPase subunit MlaF
MTAHSSQLAVRYHRKTARHEVQAAVPKGAVTRVHVPDDDAKAHLVTALLKARCEPGEELELFGEGAAALAARRRGKLRARVGAVSPIVGLITNLNAWENISLPAAYHGSPPLEQVAALAHEVLVAFGADPRAFLARIPDELGMLERKMATFVRSLVAAPELMVFDALEDGLSYAECRHAARFEAEYRARQPQGTVLYVDTREES